MKNTIFLALAAILFSASVNAQSTVDSIEAKYKLLPMPGALTFEKTFPVLGNYQLQPAGSTAADASTTTSATSNVIITLDSVNKGMIWISGLPQGTVKAYLKKAPATYRILAQKTDAGKQIPEGTLIFDPETRALNIALGSAYNEANPAAIFANLNANAVSTVDAAPVTVKVKTKKSAEKSKSKVTYYTATKIEQNATTIQ